MPQPKIKVGTNTTCRALLLSLLFASILTSPFVRATAANELIESPNLRDYLVIENAETAHDGLTILQKTDALRAIGSFLHPLAQLHPDTAILASPSGNLTLIPVNYSRRHEALRSLRAISGINAYDVYDLVRDNGARAEFRDCNLMKQKIVAIRTHRDFRTVIAAIQDLTSGTAYPDFTPEEARIVTANLYRAAQWDISGLQLIEDVYRKIATDTGADYSDLERSQLWSIPPQRSKRLLTYAIKTNRINRARVTTTELMLYSLSQASALKLAQSSEPPERFKTKVASLFDAVERNIQRKIRFAKRTIARGKPYVSLFPPEPFADELFGDHPRWYFLLDLIGNEQPAIAMLAAERVRSILETYGALAQELQRQLFEKGLEQESRQLDVVTHTQARLEDLASMSRLDRRSQAALTILETIRADHQAAQCDRVTGS